MFQMVDDKASLPNDFELLLRKAALEHKIDVAGLRDSEGCTLLHRAVIGNRPAFVLPFLRVGCWDSTCKLRVETGKNHEHETRDAAEIAVKLKLKKVLKELDMCATWEKSLNVIHKSARAGNLSEVKKWLEYSSDLHMELDSMGCSTLYWACIGGNLDVVKLLIKRKVDPTQVNARKETLLHAACMMGHSHLIMTLRKECKLSATDAKDVMNRTPLRIVMENGDEKSLAELTACGLDAAAIGPLLSVCGHSGRLNLLRAIVENRGVDPQFKDEAGRSAFLRAAEQGRMDVLNYYFSRNDVNLMETDRRGRNVLHTAADGATVEVISHVLRRLEEKGIDVKSMINARDKYVGIETCMLIRGVDKGRDSWHYVDVSRGLCDVFSKRTREGVVDVTKYGTLLQSGWGTDPDESTLREMEKRFEMRLNSKSAADDADETPLHIAAFRGKPDVAGVLVDHGAQVNARDKFGMTALHLAAMRGNVELVRRLVASGASHDLLDCAMKTPAQVAEDNEHPAVANYLKGINYLPIVEVRL